MREASVSVLVFQIVSLVWLVAEIARGVRLRAARRHGDRTAGTAGGAWIVFAAIGLSAAAAVASQRTAVPRLPLPADARYWVGTVVIVLGAVIRWHAIRTLGRLFTMNVAIREGHEIIQRGLYRWVISWPGQLGERGHLHRGSGGRRAVSHSHRGARPAGVVPGCV